MSLIGGALRSEVIRLVLERSLLFVVMGLVVGLSLALAASGLTGSLLAGRRGSNLLTLAVAVFLPGFIVLVTALVATRRAPRIDPGLPCGRI